MMPRILTSLYAFMVIAAIAFVGTSASWGQTPAPNTSETAATTVNKPLAKQLSRERQAAKKEKRASCERQAREQNLRRYKRWRFIRACLKG